MKEICKKYWTAMFVILFTSFLVFVQFTGFFKIHAAGTVSGTVFKDFNGNGVKDGTSEVGVSGIIVTAYDGTGTARGTATTLSTGAYSLSATGNGPYRIEFTAIPSYLSPSAKSTDSVNGDSLTTSSGSTVQFVADGTTSNVNLALNNPSDYSQANPRLVIPVQEHGSGSGSTDTGFVSFTYNGATDYPATYGGTGENPRADAQIQQIGAVWGVGYQKKTKRVYTAAVTKRHSGFGPRGIDGVYILDYSSSTSASVVGGFDLQSVTPSNGGAAIDLGSVTRTIVAGAISAGAAGDNQLSDTNTQPTRDMDAFDKVGKTGFGDIDVSEDGNTLWLVNLNQRALISVNISSFTPSTANPATPPGPVNQYLLSNLAGVPTCANGVFRPWALAFNEGRGYLGGVCSAENVADRNDNSGVIAYVLSFDPANPVGGFTTATNFSMNYPNGREAVEPGQTSSRGLATFHPWARTWSDTGLVSNVNARIAYPQPVLSDIEFNETGAMILGFMDRFGNQMGRTQYYPVSANTNTTGINAGGDIVHLCRSGSSFILEGQTGCADSDPGNTSGNAGEMSNDGPSGTGEFYYTDEYSVAGTATHLELSTGALALKKGSGEVINTVYDPVEGAGTSFVFTQGLHFYNTTNGSRTDQYQIVNGTVGSTPPYFGKGNGLGDIELLDDVAPIEIGNRVWRDSNSDGVQTPGETGIANVTVRLYNAAGTLIATAVTDANGEFYFSSASGTSTASTIYGLNLLPNTAYSIRVDNPTNFNSGNPLAGLTLTSSNVSSQAGFADGSDSDATNVNNPTGSPTSGVFPVISMTTGSSGQNNHTYDFGFRSSPTAAGVSVGGRALDNWWNGIAGVQVTLTTQDGISKTTLTDQNGFFAFDEVVGQTAIVTVTAKSKIFTPDNQFVSLTESTDGLYFFAKSSPRMPQIKTRGSF